MKKWYAFLLMSLIVLSVAGVAHAGEFQGYTTIGLVIDGKNIHSDVPGILMSDRTMVPIRVISESLNATVTYDRATNNVIIVPNGTQAPSVTPAKVTGEFAGLPKVGVIVSGKALNGDVPPVTLNDRTLVPVRMVAEALGAKVNYANNTVTISSAATQADKINDDLTVIEGSSLMENEGDIANIIDMSDLEDNTNPDSSLLDTSKL